MEVKKLFMAAGYAGGSDISMDPEIVKSEMTNFKKEFERFQALTDDFFKTNERLKSWNSPNKALLEEKINGTKPAFTEIAEVTASYHDVGVMSASRIEEAEARIKSSFMN